MFFAVYVICSPWKPSQILRLLRGVDRKDAEKLFLGEICGIKLYGVEIHEVKNQNSEPEYLGVDARGVIIFTIEQYEKDLEVGLRIQWRQIKEFRYRETKFILVTKTKDQIIEYSLKTTAKGKLTEMFWN